MVVSRVRLQVGSDSLVNPRERVKLLKSSSEPVSLNALLSVPNRDYLYAEDVQLDPRNDTLYYYRFHKSIGAYAKKWQNARIVLENDTLPAAPIQYDRVVFVPFIGHDNIAHCVAGVNLLARVIREEGSSVAPTRFSHAVDELPLPLLLAGVAGAAGLVPRVPRHRPQHAPAQRTTRNPYQTALTEPAHARVLQAMRSPFAFLSVTAHPAGPAPLLVHLQRRGGAVAALALLSQVRRSCHDQRAEANHVDLALLQESVRGERRERGGSTRDASRQSRLRFLQPRRFLLPVRRPRRFGHPRHDSRCAAHEHPVHDAGLCRDRALQPAAVRVALPQLCCELRAEPHRLLEYDHRVAG